MAISNPPSASQIEEWRARDADAIAYSSASNMTIRQHYIGQIAAGLAGRQGLYAKPEKFAERVVTLADAVLAEMAKGGDA